MPERVGVIGLGLMGQSFAERLLAAGHEVLGYDVAADKGEWLDRKGGKAVATIAEIAASCPVIIVAVMTIGQVEDVVLGAGGIGENVPAGATRTVLCCSTCEAERIADLAVRCAPNGIVFLDTPVSGTSRQVAEGEGLGLVAGPEEAIVAADSLLRVIYPRYRVTGAPGSATLTKLAINHILGINRLALAEGLVFAETMGLDIGNFFETALMSAAYSQVMETKGHKMVAGDYTPVSKVSQHLKDVKVIVNEAASRGQPLPLAEVLAEVLRACEVHGDGERDNAITIEELRRRRR